MSKDKKINEYVYGFNGKWYKTMPIVDAEDRSCTCWSCDKTLDIGDSIQYETSGYTTYCDDTECTEGVATYGTCLEDCWWGDFEDEVYVDKDGNILLDEKGNPVIFKTDEDWSEDE